MKHSKIRNTGFLFELLTRQVTADIINETKSSVASNILKKHFNKKSELFKENTLFNVILETKLKDTERAKHLIATTIKAHRKNVNESKLKAEKYNLIKDIKENFNISDFFKSRLHNYKLLASIHNVISEDFSNPVKSSKSFYTVLEHISSNKKKEQSTEIMESLRKENSDLRALTYKILVERFNKKYSKLSQNQKDVLKEYIHNVSNTNGLKEFMESKYKMIISEFKKLFPKIDDKVVKIKITECLKLIRKINVTPKNETTNVLKLMRFYQLLEDVKHAVSK